MDYPPEGLDWSSLEDGSAEPSQEYSTTDQDIYQPANYYEPDLPLEDGSIVGGGYTEDRIERTPSRYSTRDGGSGRYGYQATRVEEYSCPTCGQNFRSERERHRHYQTNHVGNGERSFRCDVEDCAADVNSWRNPEKLNSHNKRWHRYSCNVPGCSRTYPRGFESEQALENHMQVAHQASSLGTMLQDSYAPPNDGSYETASTQSNYMPADFQPTSLTSSSAHEYGVDSNLSPSLANKPGVMNSRDRKLVIKGTLGYTEPLDSRFKIQPSSFFKPGRVFKILWNESTSEQENQPSDGEETKYRVAHGEYVYSKIRRFVVIRNFHGHSECLPISTYGGRGLLKKGVVAEHHAKIFIKDHDVSTDMEKKEKRLLSRRPIGVQPDSDSETLDAMSRLNYAKIYTVEHNVKVLRVGRVAKEYQKTLIQDFDDIHRPLAETWEQPEDFQQGPQRSAYEPGPSDVMYSPIQKAYSGQYGYKGPDEYGGMKGPPEQSDNPNDDSYPASRSTSGYPVNYSGDEKDIKLGESTRRSAHGRGHRDRERHRR